MLARFLTLQKTIPAVDRRWRVENRRLKRTDFGLRFSFLNPEFSILEWKTGICRGSVLRQSQQSIHFANTPRLSIPSIAQFSNPVLFTRQHILGPTVQAAQGALQLGIDLRD